MAYGYKTFEVEETSPAREPIPGKVKAFRPLKDVIDAAAYRAQGPTECDCCGNDTTPGQMYVSEDGADQVCGMCQTGRCGCDEGDH